MSDDELTAALKGVTEQVAAIQKPKGPPPWLAYVSLVFTTLAFVGGSAAVIAKGGALISRVEALEGDVAGMKGEKFVAKADFTLDAKHLRMHVESGGHSPMGVRMTNVEKWLQRLEDRMDRRHSGRAR